MDDLLSVGGKYYILAESSVADERTYALKYGHTFAVFDRHGNIRPLGIENHGVFHEGTRFLSRYILRVEGKVPLLLNTTIVTGNDLLAVNMTNPDFHTRHGRLIPRGSLFINRSLFVWGARCCERLRIVNYSAAPLQLGIVYQFDADYRDIFEVRGMERHQRGTRLPAQCTPHEVLLAYTGLDGVERRTRVRCETEPTDVSADSIAYAARLEPHDVLERHLTTTCEIGNSRKPNISCRQARDALLDEQAERRVDACTITTTNEAFNEWLERSSADLSMMLTKTPHGWYPYAGIPWFNTVFGRDGIITGMQTLWMDPSIARGVLSYLAAYQADEVDPERDAEPGKIVHEQRRGEMAVLREIPFGNYYGTIDATPLFLVLAGRYYERTGDLEFIRKLWPNIERALNWIEEYGDINGDGFVEFERHSETGLSQQGWKDSDDSCFHADGRDPEPPIALCEVQAYVYEAKTRAAELAMALGRFQDAFALHDQAQKLASRFDDVFWCEDLGLYAMAIDGSHQACRIATSNAGQCLLSGIANPLRVDRLCRRLMEPDFFSGWGIRTLAEGQTRYNPMSYHNGSIWPHDNALIAAGMARYAYKTGTMQLLEGLFEASRYLALYRLPELFCGFPRRAGEGPTLYPVACLPQAWASTSVFFVLQACLGLRIDAPDRKVIFDRPALPPSLNEMAVNNLAVGDARVDLRITRHAEDVGFNITRKTHEDLEILVIK